MDVRSCREAFNLMSHHCEQHAVRNYTQTLGMRDYLVETDLFSRDALEAYSCWNLEKEISADQKKFFSEMRGGKQGDYRDGMREKIDNVVDCLTKYPQSKRAVIATCNEAIPHHSSDQQAKCLRELHLYLDDNGKLSGTVLLRAQAVNLFPKNIHFVGSIMSEVADRLPQEPGIGNLFYLATILVSDRT